MQSKPWNKPLKPYSMAKITELLIQDPVGCARLEAIAHGLYSKLYTPYNTKLKSKLCGGNYVSSAGNNEKLQSLR